MSDFENDSDCLKIHLGSRLSDSSDSGDNGELDEEYHILRPLPISAAVIRQNAIYRPPSPSIEQSKKKVPVPSRSRTGKKVPQAKSSTKNVPTIVRRKQDKIKFTQEDQINGVHLKIAKDLVKVQYEMSTYSAKLSLSYLDALDKFRINLDCFGNSIKNLNSKKSLAIYSISPPEIIVTLENSIENFKTLLSNLYAFIISEYLLILIESSRFNKSRITTIIIKTLDLIENFGSINEIQKKLQYRTLKNVDDLNFGPFVVVKSTNDQIMNELNILFPKTNDIKKTKKGKIKEKKLNFTKYIGPKQKVSSDEKQANKNDVRSTSQEIFGYEEITTENKKIKNSEKSIVPLATSNTVVQISNSSNDKVENFNNSVNCQSVCNTFSTVQESSSVVISSSKRKRKKRGKKKICSKEIQSVEKSTLSNVNQNLLEKKTHVNITNIHSFVSYNNEVARAENKHEFDIENIRIISEKLTNINIADSQDIVSRVDNSEKYKLNTCKENEEIRINGVNTNLNAIFEKSSDGSASTGNIISSELIGHEEFKKAAFDEIFQNNGYRGTKHEDFKSPYNEIMSKHGVDNSSKKSEVINEAQNACELENFLDKIDKDKNTSFSSTCNSEPLGMKQNPLNKMIKVYEANCTSEDTKENIEICKDIIGQNPKNPVMSMTKGENENCDIIESVCHSESELIDHTKFQSNYKIGAIIYRELCEHKETFLSVKNASDAQKLEYNFEVSCQSVKDKERPHFITESVLRLAEFSNLKIISLLNTLQFSITNFELEYSSAAFDTIKHCLEVLHYIHIFNDLMLNVSSAEKLVEIKKCYLPISRVCQAHLYAFIVSQSTEFIRSLKCRRGEDEAKVLYPEFLELTDILGTPEEISEKLKYRNDNIYIELAQQVCSVIPVSYISASNRDIVGNIESIRKARKKFIIKPIEVLVHHLKLPTTVWMPKCTEFDNLHFDIKKAEILVVLENHIYYSDLHLSDTDLKSKFENMQKFCILLKTLEQEKGEVLLGTFVHAFLHNIDSILSHHILRILISQFYSFIFHMISFHFSNLSKMSSKKNVKSFCNILINLMSLLCPIEQIPEKLRFRNDELFMEFTNNLYGIKGIKIEKSSKELCKEISVIIKSNKSIFQRLTTGYVSLPVDFKSQILKLEGKVSKTHELLNTCMREKNGKMMTFKTLAIDIMQEKQTGSPKHTSPLNSKQIKLKHSSPSIKPLALSLGELKSETTLITNCNKSNDSLKLEVQLSKSNFQNTQIYNWTENVDGQSSEIVAEVVDTFITKTWSELKYRDTETSLISREYNWNAINVLNVLQYSMNTFEIKYSNAAIKVLKDCVDILDGISKYNRSLLNVSSEKFLIDNFELCYLSLSEVCQSNLYANILYLCCLFEKALRNQCIYKEKLYFQLIEIIEAFGTIEDIWNKLKRRNDHLYVIYAQKVCSIIPVVCPPLSNIEILEQLLEIRNSLGNQTDSITFVLKDVLQFSTVDLEAEIRKMTSQKWIEMESLQVDLEDIEVMSTLQYYIHHSDKYTSEVNSVFESMKTFLVLLDKLDRNQENGPVVGTSVHELLINLKTVLHRHVLRILVSHFYSYILFAILQFIHLSNSSEEKVDCFRLTLFNLLISICPLERLPEKLQFRNDAFCLAYLKASLNVEGIVVAKSSETILQETLDIFKTNKIYSEKIESEFFPSGSSIKLDEFERNIVPTKELNNISLDKGICSGIFQKNLTKDLNTVGDIETLPIASNLDKKEVESSVIASKAKSEIKHSVEVFRYLQTFVESDVGDIIFQIMTNSEHADIALNSIMRRIEYSCIKTITTFNILQYSFNLFQKKYCTAAFESILDCLRLLHHMEKFNKLLPVSSSTKFQEITISYTPIIEVCQTYFYAYVMSSCSNFLRVLKSDEYQKKSKIYSKVFEMITAFGNHEEIYEKLKNRNDNWYIELVKELCSVIPSTLILPCNDYLLQNITYVEDLSESNKIQFEFIISENPRTMSMEHKVRSLSNKNLKYECPQLDLNKIKVIIELQCDINFYDQFPTKFCIVFENMINFFVKLKNFEQDEIELSGSGNFVDEFLENLDIISSRHISRILIAQFYSFIFSISLNVLKMLPELVSINEVNFFHHKLINLLSSNCAIDEVFQKIQFRNDAVYSNYIGDILNMKVIEVSESCDEIFSGVFDLFKTNKTHIDQNSSTNFAPIHSNMEDLGTDEYEVYKLNNHFKVVNSSDIPRFTLLRETFKIKSKDSHSSKYSQNIYLSFQDHNDSTFIVLNFVDKIFINNKMKNDIYMSFSSPKSSESECKYININNEMRIFEQYENKFLMIFECSVSEELQIIFWKNLLRFAQKLEYDDILSEVSSETKKIFHVFLKKFVCTKNNNFEERKKMLYSIPTEFDDEKKCLIQFDSISGLILNVISKQMDQLITDQKFANVFEMVLSFKQIFLCILKRINELCEVNISDIIKDYRMKNLIHEINLLQPTNIGFFEEINPSDFDFTLHRENQYFSLCEILEFLVSRENFVCSELPNSYISRFFRLFDIVIFDCCIPFELLENIQHHLMSEQTSKKENKKIELFLKKNSHKNKCSAEYFNTEYLENSCVPCSNAIEKQEFDFSVHQEHVHQICSEYSHQIENALQSTCFEKLDESSMLEIVFEWSVIFLFFNIIIKSYFFYITILWIVMFHLQTYL